MPTHTIKLFGLIKTLADNQAELTVRLNGQQRVRDLVASLDTVYPRVAELIHTKRVLISVNQEIAQERPLTREMKWHYCRHLPAAPCGRGTACIHALR